MLICVLSLCCGGVAADVRYDFALLPLYGVRLVTYILRYLEISGRLPYMMVLSYMRFLSQSLMSC